MHNVIQVLIVEDDFRIADINRQLIDQVEGFETVGMAKTGAEAMSILKGCNELPHLILLDVYIPDSEGLSLFWELRNDYQQIDIIMLTAAKEVATIEETLRGGIFDYIIKPVDFSRFEQTLTRYQEQRALLSSKIEFEQEDIDCLSGLQVSIKTPNNANESFPKGIDQITLAKVIKTLKASHKSGINALNMGKELGVSRSTARRYLEYLVSINQVEVQLDYGVVGRPERKYVPWTE